MKLIFHFIPLLNGYGIEFYMVGYVFGLILIENRKWQWTFGVLTPWVLLCVPPSIVNFWDLLLEYIVAWYIFLPFIYFDLIIKIINKKIKNNKMTICIQMIVFTFCLVVFVFIKLTLHTIAGKLWWTPSDSWYSSFIFNLPIYLGTLIIVLPTCLLCYVPLMSFKENKL